MTWYRSGRLTVGISGGAQGRPLQAVESAFEPPSMTLVVLFMFSIAIQMAASRNLLALLSGLHSSCQATPAKASEASDATRATHCAHGTCHRFLKSSNANWTAGLSPPSAS